MPTSKVRLADTGEVVTVEHAAGASPEEIKRLARQPKPTAPPEKPPAGPDIVGRAHRALTAEPPMGDRTAVSRKIFGEKIGSWDTPGRYVRAAGDLFLPSSVPQAAAMGATMPIGGAPVKAAEAARGFIPAAARALTGNVVTAPLKRVGAAALASGGAAAAQGRDWASSILEGGTQGVSQFVGELLPGALRFGKTQQSGQLAIASREKKMAYDRAMHDAITDVESDVYKGSVAEQRTREAARVREARATYQEQVRDMKSRHEQATSSLRESHATATTAAKGAYETARREYAEQGAASIADAFKGKVSAWRDFESNEKGLLGMIYGEGQAKLSAAYDAVMKEIVALGKGRSIEIPLKDAQALGIRFFATRGPIEKGMPDMTRVDVSQLASAATGYWKKNPGIYRRAAAALDTLDIGDPAARSEYKAGQALIQFADKTQMLKGERFNPEAARAGFTKLKTLDELRRRGQGDVFTGPVADAVRRPAPELKLPAEPTMPADPKVPAFRRPAPEPKVEPPPKRVLLDPPQPEGVTTKKIPNIGFWPGAAVAEIPFLVQSLVTGQPHHGYGLPGALTGLATAAASGRNVVTKAPLSPLTEFATGVLPPFMAQEARHATGAAPITTTPGEGPSTADIDRQMLERFGPKP